MKKSYENELTVQQIVNYLGDKIVKDNLSGSVTKGIGEVKINETMYQIQLSLEPEGGKWIDGNEIFTFKKLSWKQKIINLFTFITDAGIQK